MTKKINIAELLEDCPKGMELDCTMYENLYFDYISNSISSKIYPIHCYTEDNLKAKHPITFTLYGQHYQHDSAKCVIFPKGKTTWEGFVPPCKFKEGDKIRHKINNGIYEISAVYDGFYGLVDYAFMLDMKYQDDYELVRNKFDVTTLKPFESKVLVRDTVKEIWKPDFFGCLYDSNDYPYMVVGGIRWKCCIPFEGNEHLLGTTNDCEEYFKTW